MDKHTPEEKKALGRRLAKVREDKGLKQEVAAAKVGVTKAALSAWETGRNLPDALSLRKLALAYGVSSDAILLEQGLAGDAMEAAMELAELPTQELRNRILASLSYMVRLTKAGQSFTLSPSAAVESPPTLRRSSDR